MEKKDIWKINKGITTTSGHWWHLGRFTLRCLQLGEGLLITSMLKDCKMEC